MVELGFGEMLSVAQTIGIRGTMVLTLFFSKKQIQSLSIDTQTRGLNDLDEKFHKMAEIIMEDPPVGRVIDIEGKASRELAFSFYISGYVLMRTRCDEEKYLMIMNGEGGYNG